MDERRTEVESFKKSEEPLHACVGVCVRVHVCVPCTIGHESKSQKERDDGTNLIILKQ